jgi:predicted nucleic acid-binding protein
MIQTSKKPVIVLDTNVLLVSIPSKSKYRWIFEKLINAEFEMCISNEILMEYEEIFRRKFSNEMVENILELLLTAGNVKKNYAMVSLASHRPGQGRQQVRRLRNCLQRRLHHNQ